MTCVHAQGLQNQGLQLQEINENPGLLPVKQGRASLQYDSWSIIKTIDLTGISSDLQFHSQQYSIFCNKVILASKNVSSLIIKFKDFQTQIEYIRDEATEKLQKLIPSKRVKRGLINPLGSLIKVITGNLDNDDAIHFEQLITDTQTREQAVSNKITIITEMLDHIVNSSEIVNENTKLLNDRVNKIELYLRSHENFEELLTFHIINVFNLFISNFRTISIKLGDVETALALSKVSVLHKTVIDSVEIITLLKEISTYGKLMYPVNNQNLINLEETFSVKAYLKDSYVRFIIDVPLVENECYVYYKLYPLPMLNHTTADTFTIIPEYPYLLQDEKSYRPLAQKCKEITAKEYLCSESSIAPYFAETCVEQLMKYRAHLPKCSKHKVITEELKTQKISDNVWIIFSKFKKVLTQKCSDDVIQEPLRGTYILTIQKPCDVTIGTLRLRANRFHELGNSYNHIPIVNLPDLSENKMENMEPINLQRVNLDDVQHLNYMLKKSVKSVQNSSEVKSLGIATIVLYIILLVFLVYILQLKCIPYIRKIYETPSTPVIEHENVNENPILLVS